MPENPQYRPLIQNALNYARANGQPLPNQRGHNSQALPYQPRCDSQALLFNVHGFGVAIRDADDDYLPDTVTIDRLFPLLTLCCHNQDDDSTFRIWDASRSMDRLRATKPTEPGDLSIHWRHFQPEGLLAAMEAINDQIMADWHPDWEEKTEYTIHQLLRLLLIPAPAAEQTAAAA